MPSLWRTAASARARRVMPVVTWRLVRGVFWRSAAVYLRSLSRYDREWRERMPASARALKVEQNANRSSARCAIVRPVPVARA
ncbi:hypothetical protein A4V12_26100 [Streptomyces noursei]|nr:hypothetical protein A4V12_26100 [Streptomyces noursei]